MANMKCAHYCPEGEKCHCNGDITHVLHVCSSRYCPCHSAERYAEAKRIRLAEKHSAAPAITIAKLV